MLGAGVGGMAAAAADAAAHGEAPCLQQSAAAGRARGGPTHPPAMTSALPRAASLAAVAASWRARATSSSRVARASATWRSHSSTSWRRRSSRAATLRHHGRGSGGRSQAALHHSWRSTAAVSGARPARAGDAGSHNDYTAQEPADPPSQRPRPCRRSNAPRVFVPQCGLALAQLAPRLGQARLMAGRRLAQPTRHALQPLQLCIPLLQQLRNGQRPGGCWAPGTGGAQGEAKGHGWPSRRRPLLARCPSPPGRPPTHPQVELEVGCELLQLLAQQRRLALLGSQQAAQLGCEGCAAAVRRCGASLSARPASRGAAGRRQGAQWRVPVILECGRPRSMAWSRGCRNEQAASVGDGGGGSKGSGRLSNEACSHCPPLWLTSWAARLRMEAAGELLPRPGGRGVALPMPGRYPATPSIDGRPG